MIKIQMHAGLCLNSRFHASGTTSNTCPKVCILDIFIKSIQALHIVFTSKQGVYVPYHNKESKFIVRFLHKEVLGNKYMNWHHIF